MKFGGAASLFTVGEVTTVVLHTPYEPPPLLGNPQVTATAGSTSVHLSWNADANAQGFEVQWKTGVEVYLTTGSTRRAVTSATSVIINELLDSESYDFRVRALTANSNLFSNSGYTEVSVNTLTPPLPPAPPIVVGIPQNLTLMPTLTTLVLNWDAAPNAFAYSVQWRGDGEAWSEMDREVTVIGITGVTIGLTDRQHRLSGAGSGRGRERRIPVVGTSRPPSPPTNHSTPPIWW